MRLFYIYSIYFGLFLALLLPARGTIASQSGIQAIAASQMEVTHTHNDQGGDDEVTARLRKENRQLKYVLLGGVVAMLLMLGGLLFLVRHLHKRQIEACRQFTLKQREADNSEAELQARHQELTGKALSLARSEEMIRQLKKDIAKLLPETDEETASGLDAVLRMLKTNVNGNDLWKDFDNRFNELNNNFITKLVALHPTLSPTEIRLSAMIRMHLSTKEIAEITRRSVRTIECTRANIRKKMDLKPSDNLTKYLLTI